MPTNYHQSYSSMAGCDIVATFADVEIGELQGISVAITREKAPSYSFGNANPRNFSRGKRGIAGTAVFGHYDRNAFLFAMTETSSYGKYFAWNHESFPSSQNPREYLELPSLTTLKTERKAYYSDQILPFEIVLTAKNEYGAAAEMALYGTEIVNESQGFSIDDVLNSMSITYVCRDVNNWWTGEGRSYAPGNGEGGGLIGNIIGGVREVGDVLQEVGDVVEGVGDVGEAIVGLGDQIGGFLA